MVVLGIDVGKSELYACLLRPELKPARQVVANTAEGQVYRAGSGVAPADVVRVFESGVG